MQFIKKTSLHIMSHINYSVCCLLCTLLLMLIPGSSYGGTYTSTKHAASANRSVIDVTFPYTTNGLCAHCHESHASIGGSEPTPPSAEGPTSYTLFRENIGIDRNELCFACHEVFNLGSMPTGYGEQGIYQGKTKYNNSIHYSSGNMVWSPDDEPPGPPYDDSGNCHNCHNPHGYDDGSGLVPYMLFARDSKTGDSPAYESGCEACHDGTQGGAFKDVQAQLNKTYTHPAHTYNNRHSLPEAGQPGGSSFGPSNRHAECVDCHNPHALGSTGDVHTAPGNAVSDPIKNVWGVEPSWPSIWTQPTSLTVIKPPAYTDGAEYEYQICFKCHSYHGLGIVTGGVSTITGPSGQSITDQAWELNVNNKSAHPVVVSLNNQTGSGSPKSLTSDQMSSPWNSGVGSNTMYCSDCHGADNESSGAKGPHGSTAKFMLKGTGKYWPLNPAGGKWTMTQINSGHGDYRSNWQNELFCANCHPMDYESSPNHEAHRRHDENSSIYCVSCHVAVPHGYRRSRLIGYSGDLAPYNYDNSLQVEGFKKAASHNDYESGNCYATTSPCHTDHSTNEGPYEP